MHGLFIEHGKPVLYSFSAPALYAGSHIFRFLKKYAWQDVPTSSRNLHKTCRYVAEQIQTHAHHRSIGGIQPKFPFSPQRAQPSRTSASTIPSLSIRIYTLCLVLYRTIKPWVAHSVQAIDHARVTRRLPMQIWKLPSSKTFECLTRGSRRYARLALCSARLIARFGPHRVRFCFQACASVQVRYGPSISHSPTVRRSRDQ